jgi:hypothetical protein
LVGPRSWSSLAAPIKEPWKHNGCEGAGDCIKIHSATKISILSSYWDSPEEENRRLEKLHRLYSNPEPMSILSTQADECWETFKSALLNN